MWKSPSRTMSGKAGRRLKQPLNTSGSCRRALSRARTKRCRRRRLTSGREIWGRSSGLAVFATTYARASGRHRGHNACRQPSTTIYGQVLRRSSPRDTTPRNGGRCTMTGTGSGTTAAGFRIKDSPAGRRPMDVGRAGLPRAVTSIAVSATRTTPKHRIPDCPV